MEKQNYYVAAGTSGKNDGLVVDSGRFTFEERLNFTSFETMDKKELEIFYEDMIFRINLEYSEQNGKDVFDIFNSDIIFIRQISAFNGAELLIINNDDKLGNSKVDFSVRDLSKSKSESKSIHSYLPFEKYGMALKQ